MTTKEPLGFQHKHISGDAPHEIFPKLTPNQSETEPKPTTKQANIKHYMCFI